MTRFATTLFDFDGTVVDSGPIILASFRHATRTVLRREIADEDLLAHSGGASLREQMTLLDPDRFEELERSYREHNEPAHAELRAFSGMEDVLGALVADRRRVGLVTAKRRATVELAFRYLPLAQYFETLVTAEDTDEHKPHPAPVLAALARLASSPGDAVYVGDSPFDIRAGKDAGATAIAVTWGGMHPLDRVLDEGPDAVATTPEELLALLS